MPSFSFTTFLMVSLILSFVFSTKKKNTYWNFNFNSINVVLSKVWSLPVAPTIRSLWLLQNGNISKNFSFYFIIVIRIFDVEASLLLLKFNLEGKLFEGEGKKERKELKSMFFFLVANQWTIFEAHRTYTDAQRGIGTTGEELMIGFEIDSSNYERRSSIFSPPIFIPFNLITAHHRLMLMRAQTLVGLVRWFNWVEVYRVLNQLTDRVTRSSIEMKSTTERKSVEKSPFGCEHEIATFAQGRWVSWEFCAMHSTCMRMIYAWYSYGHGNRIKSWKWL